MTAHTASRTAPGGAQQGIMFHPASLLKPAKWRYYFANGTSGYGALLAACNGVTLTHYFGPAIGLGWTILAIAMLLGVVYLAVRAGRGEDRLRNISVVSHMASIALWMISAAALWFTGERAAWVIAIISCSSWAIHIIFSGETNSLRVKLLVLSVATVPLLGFLVWSAWTSFPVWVAAPTTLSAVAMVFSIATSAERSSRTFHKMHAAMAEARATRSRLEFAIEAVGDGYFELDLDTMKYEPNPGLAEKLGFHGRSETQQRVAERIHPDEAEMIWTAIEATRAGRSPGFNLDVRVRASDGVYRWMHVRARVLAAAGENRRLIGTMADLTERKKLEDDLRAAKEAAESSNAAKSQFLANMSHEIRTPLNGVLGMAQALEQDALDPAQREKVAVILDSGRSLMSLLNDVLDISKIEAGKLEISPVPGDFLHTMKRTRQLFQSTAEDKGLDLLVRYDSNFPQRMVYDPTRVRQCVANMLSNAIKFTATGRIEVGISARALGDGQHMVCVEVADTGIGMSQATIDKLFTVFTQADGATTRKFGGSGLGLAISRQLARLMGGDLVVESEEGRGSTFRLTFRAPEASASSGVQRGSQPAMADQPPRSLRGIRVLLTDDNAVNRQVIKLFLAPQAMDITEATNGKEALDLLSTREFDVVLLDVHMPVMDGKEAIQRMRASREAWGQLPVIALTADAMSGDREKYLALGMSDYVSKPVDQRELLARLHGVLGIETPAPVAKTGT
ncbi:MAG: response regulator [Alphaproteobacteria bacterium]|nr:response regulator [Alphaproteobacteria bacterium]